MLNLKPQDHEKLLYIHSNGNITPSLFKDKFFKDMTLRRAFQLLERYEAKGYLFFHHKHAFFQKIYALTDKALKELYDKGLLLALNLKSPHIRTNKQTHDEGLAALRIALETNPDFDDLFFLSEFEIGQGITREAKWKFYRELEVEGRMEFLKKWKPRYPKKGERRPDGRFEALVKGEIQSYVLEYERMPYGNARIIEVVNKIEDTFKDPAKVIVCETPKRAAEVKIKIESAMANTHRRGGFRSQWLISDLPTTLKTPFFKAFEPIQKPTKAGN